MTDQLYAAVPKTCMESEWGMTQISEEILQYYYVLQMLYRADLWLKLLQISNKNSQRFMSKMAMVQRQAALHATGVLHTTPYDVLSTHANMLPFDIEFHQALHRCTLQ
jgi:hypothetical protein